MMDRITIIGIRIPNIRRMKDAERVSTMKSKVEGFLSKLKDEGQRIDVIFVRHLNRQARNPENTVLEVRLGNGEQALSVRNKFVKVRDETEWENFNITPTVRLATRVRIEILQAVSKVVKAKDTSVSRTQCLQFVNKPVLKVFRKDDRGNEYFRVMSFIDSVVWIIENEFEKQLDLRKAYQKAGSNFRSTITQHFVIMN
jgi:hypothetical protein